tara:strand:- start:78 stop:827 length:750 start_codon:yes stop_codon:yes gene_type:complete
MIDISKRLSPGEKPIPLKEVVAAVDAVVESRDSLAKQLLAATKHINSETLPIDSPHLTEAIEQRFHGLGTVKAHFPNHVQLVRGDQFIGDCGRKYVILGFASWRPSFGIVCAKVSAAMQLSGLEVAPPELIKSLAVQTYRTSWVLDQLGRLEPFRKHNLIAAADKMGIESVAIESGIYMDFGGGKFRFVRVIDVVMMERAMPIRVVDVKTGEQFKVSASNLREAQKRNGVALKRPAPEANVLEAKKQAV